VSRKLDTNSRRQHRQISINFKNFLSTKAKLLTLSYRHNLVVQFFGGTIYYYYSFLYYYYGCYYNLLVGVDVGDILPVKSVDTMRHHERRDPFLTIAPTLRQKPSHLHVTQRSVLSLDCN